MKRNPIDNPDQFVEVICAGTGEKFLKYKGEYNRQIREGTTRFFKNSKIAGLFFGARRKAKEVIKLCLQCKKEFSSTNKARAATYCSRSCAASHSHFLLSLDEERFRSRKFNCSKAAKQYNEKQRKNNPLPKIERTCVICNASFEPKYRHNQVKTCKKDCQRILRSKLTRENPNCGGETNYKHYSYQNITMDSAWEVEIAQWMDAHNVKWTRSRKMMFYWTDETGAKRRYYPDFYLPDFNVYLDPKNKYLIEKDRFKILTVQRENGINIIWGLKETLLTYLESLIKPPISLVL